MITFGRFINELSSRVKNNNTTNRREPKREKVNLLTGEQHTDYTTSGQRVSHYELPTLMYFLYSPPHIFFIIILSPANGTLTSAAKAQPNLQAKAKKLVLQTHLKMTPYDKIILPILETLNFDY